MRASPRVATAWARAVSVGGAMAWGATVGCATLAPTSAPVLAPTGDPTPLAKCRVSASASSPLVTEWPASEKAHLESLARARAVAVQYSGCEMRIVDECRLPGAYVWRPTTLATDTLEIASADDLYAKLPLGAVSLEGELERSGRLAVRTTVAGQLHLDGGGADEAAQSGACAEATHVITAISVGAFQLLSGGAVAAGGGAGIVGGRTERSESVMREAGTASACTELAEQAPHAQCASPIQLFLTALRPPTASGPPARDDSPAAEEDEARRSGVRLILAAPPEGESWTLRDYSGKELCSLPCERWIRTNSGAYVQREVSGDDTSIEVVKLPDRFSQGAGGTAYGTYAAERGSPLWSTISFYGLGIPAAIGGVIVLSLGIFGDDCDRSDPDCDPTPFAGAAGIIGGTMYLSVAGATAYWYLWSHPARFETHPTRRARSGSPQVVLGPTGVGGTF